MLWHEYSKRLEGVEDSISDVEIAPNPAPEVERCGSGGAVDCDKLVTRRE